MKSRRSSAPTPPRASRSFVHGLWLPPSSWDRWATVFEKSGYTALTPGWPDDTVAEANAHPEIFAHKTVPIRYTLPPSGESMNDHHRTAASLLLLAALVLHPCVVHAQAPIDSIPRHQTFTIDSRALTEQRTINVYTPPGYAAAPGTAFPVLYMPDGGLAEDFPHVVNTVDSLIALHVIPPMIVVGIENTERRRDLTGPTSVATDSAIAKRVGGSAAFRRFVGEELMPEVRKRYRSTDETAIVGESLAGLFIVETFLLEPTLFHRYIALSPSLWWNSGKLVQSAERRLAALGEGPRTLYLAVANEQDITVQTEALAATLRSRAPATLHWFYEPRPDLEHSTIFRAVAPRALATVLR